MPRLSLNALRAFEATARLRSFGAAAEELCVTHGAVSRHIRALEDQLGVLLLSRNAHATEPTPEGAQMAEGLSVAFNLIQKTVDQLKPGPLTLSCSASIMMYWLLPRLSKLKNAIPSLELSFNTSHGAIDFTRDKITVAIRLSSIPVPKGVTPIPLIEEWIGAVCSPEYMRTNRIEKPSDLERARLLATNTRPSAWADWFKATSTALEKPPQIAESFDHFYLQIQAAKCGLGVAAVPRMLVRDELDSAGLVAPFGFVPGPVSLVLWVAPHAESQPKTVALVEWLRNELREMET